jgi:hypothetical protein
MKRWQMVGLLALPLATFAWSAVAEEAKKAPEQCRLHKVELKPDLVMILYGPPPFVKGEQEAWGKLFPNSNRLVLGGCVVAKDSPSVQAVKYCSRCREAQVEWFRNRDRKPSEPKPGAATL